MWYDNKPTEIRVFIRALMTAVPFYVAAFLSYSYSEVASHKTWVEIALHFVVFVILFTIFIFAHNMISIRREQIREELSKPKLLNDIHRELLLKAYSNTDKLVIDKLKQIDGNYNENKFFVETYIASVKFIDNIILTVYMFFETVFGNMYKDNNVEFDVSFMTKSYIDGFITIPSSANRHGRSMNSMTRRMNDKPKIYEDTITASIYRHNMTVPRIIEDTEDPSENYMELYPQQKKKIRSSIVYPILSKDEIVIGTLVVHCDQKRFFKRSDEEDWSQLLEIFAKRIAMEKVKIDALHSSKNNGTIRLDLTVNKPF